MLSNHRASVPLPTRRPPARTPRAHKSMQKLLRQTHLNFIVDPTSFAPLHNLIKIHQDAPASFEFRCLAQRTFLQRRNTRPSLPSGCICGRFVQRMVRPRYRLYGLSRPARRRPASGRLWRQQQPRKVGFDSIFSGRLNTTNSDPRNLPHSQIKN